MLCNCELKRTISLVARLSSKDRRGDGNVSRVGDGGSSSQIRRDTDAFEESRKGSERLDVVVGEPEQNEQNEPNAGVSSRLRTRQQDSRVGTRRGSRTTEGTAQQRNMLRLMSSNLRKVASDALETSDVEVEFAELAHSTAVERVFEMLERLAKAWKSEGVAEED